MLNILSFIKYFKRINYLLLLCQKACKYTNFFNRKEILLLEHFGSSPNPFITVTECLLLSEVKTMRYKRLQTITGSGAKQNFLFNMEIV